MPSKDELIETVESILLERLGVSTWRERDRAHRIVNTILARWPHIAGPERVETVEELDALPEGSIVLDAEDYAARVYRDAHELTEVAYPATVLHRPDATNPEEGTR